MTEKRRSRQLHDQLHGRKGKPADPGAYLTEMRALMKKIHDGDGLTDAELKTALAFFDDLATKLQCLLPEWRLAYSAALSTLQQLEYFARARADAKKGGW